VSGFTSTPGIASSSGTVGFAPTTPSYRKLTAEQKEELKKKQEERATKKRQRKETRNEARANTKAKIPGATSKKVKLRLYVTVLKLKLHF
jgi:ribosomal protein L2